MFSKIVFVLTALFFLHFEARKYDYSISLASGPAAYCRQRPLGTYT